MLIPVSGWAQGQVRGRVTDTTGDPLPGVAVLVKGSQAGTMTGPDGTFSMDVPLGSALVFSSIGYKELEQPAARQMDIVLQEDNELLEEVVKTGDTILDVGTGTGILFIAALKLGAGKAIARDIDPATLGEAKRNMNLNGVNPNVCELTEGDLLKGFSGQVNILTANILLNPNLTMLPDVKRVLKPKGYAIFSGMTHIESYTFLSVLHSSGLMVEREAKFGDWWGCRAIKAWG